MCTMVRSRPTAESLDRLLAQRGIHALGMPAWHRIDAAELELGARHGRLRTTLAHRELLAAAARPRLTTAAKSYESARLPTLQRVGDQNESVTAAEQRVSRVRRASSGVWCDDASPGMVARLARLGFDWLCLDMQHGLYSRTEIIDAARSFPPEGLSSWCGFPRVTSLPSVLRWMPEPGSDRSPDRVCGGRAARSRSNLLSAGGAVGVS